MLCPEFGKELPEGQTDCSCCETETLSQEDGVSEENKKPQKPKWKKILTIVLVVVLSLALITTTVVGVFVATNPLLRLKRVFEKTAESESFKCNMTFNIFDDDKYIAVIKGVANTNLAEEKATATLEYGKWDVDMYADSQHYMLYAGGTGAIEKIEESQEMKAISRALEEGDLKTVAENLNKMNGTDFFNPKEFEDSVYNFLLKCLFSDYLEEKFGMNVKKENDITIYSLEPNNLVALEEFKNILTEYESAFASKGYVMSVQNDLDNAIKSLKDEKNPEKFEFFFSISVKDDRLHRVDFRVKEFESLQKVELSLEFSDYNQAVLDKKILGRFEKYSKRMGGKSKYTWSDYPGF